MLQKQTHFFVLDSYIPFLRRIATPDGPRSIRFDWIVESVSVPLALGVLGGENSVTVHIEGHSGTCVLLYGIIFHQEGFPAEDVLSLQGVRADGSCWGSFCVVDRGAVS
jgi:hypothetical protein